MRSKVKTGDVFQIRRNGPNYIALGKVRDNNGVEYIAATRNGNVTKAGKYKKARGNARPKVQIFDGNKIDRVHSNRPVDIESVRSNDRRLRQHLQRTSFTTGVTTDAPNIMVQIRELASGL